MQTEFLQSSHKFFLYYKTLAEKAMLQLEEHELLLDLHGANSVAIIVQHMVGNMISRWQNFPSNDGENPNRNRDEEFSLQLRTRAEIMQHWEHGWREVFAALKRLEQISLLETTTIRGEEITAIEAVQRQIAHYAHHVGQIVFIAKMQRGEHWQSLSIPKGGSSAFNAAMLEKSTR